MLTNLHNAILTGIQAAMPSLPTVAAYPKVKKKITLPAVFIELAEMTQDDDAGTEELCLITRWEARVIYDSISLSSLDWTGMPDGELEARNLAAQVALTIYKASRWGLTDVGVAKITEIIKDEFKPELAGYLVWLIGWTHTVRLGDSIWAPDGGTQPTEVYINFDGGPYEDILA